MRKHYSKLRAVLLLTLVLAAITSVSCAREPGRTLAAPKAAPLRLGADTLLAEPIQSPHQLLLKSGEILLWLGNPGETTRQIQFSNATPEQHSLPPKAWSRIRVRCQSALELRWDGEPIQLGPVYEIGTKKAKNLLLLSVDTLRADAFTPELMPHLYALFQNGTRFQQAYASAPWTLPSHASILTGLYPARHGVRKPDQKLGQEAVTLAESLRDAGYYNIAVTEGNYVSAFYGLDQGFQQFHEDAPQMMTHDPQTISRLSDNLAYLRNTLKGLGDLPKFVFLHTYEAHCPFLPRDGNTDPAGIGATQWLLDHHGKPVDQADFKHLRSLYDGEVRYLDAQLEPLLRPLYESGEWLIVLTGDHGEEFGEHGGLLHGNTLYQETTHVPLAFLGPGVPKGSDEKPRSLVDIAPTLETLLAIPNPPESQGLDLFNPALTHPALYAESFFFGIALPSKDPRIASVWCEGDKLIQTRNFEQFQAAFFRLKEDPFERDNRQELEATRRDALFLLLQAYLDNHPLDAATLGQLPAEQLEIMRSLGYAK